MLKKSGYIDWYSTFSLTNNQIKHINANLVAVTNTGLLEIHSTPSGADIYIDGSYTGKQTNYTFTKEEGSYTIKLMKNGYYDYIANKTVVRDQTVFLNAVLTAIAPAKGSLAIYSTPDNARIFINGSFEGYTDKVLQLDPGTYSIKLTKSGYKDWTANKSVISGMTTNVYATLEEEGPYETIVYPSADTYVESDHPNSSNGNNLTMTVLLSGSQISLCLIKFNLGSIPSDANIQRGNLKLYCDDVSPNGANVEVYRIKRSWSESITWADVSTGFYSTSMIIAESVNNRNSYYTFDIENLVEDWVDGTYQSYGVLLMVSGNNTWAKFTTREISSNKPYLDIEYNK